MTNKTKKILVWVAAGLIIVGAAIGVVVDVCGGVDPEVQDTTLVEVVDTLQAQVLDTVAVDTVVAEYVTKGFSIALYYNRAYMGD